MGRGSANDAAERKPPPSPLLASPPSATTGGPSFRHRVRYGLWMAQGGRSGKAAGWVESTPTKGYIVPSSAHTALNFFFSSRLEEPPDPTPRTLPASDRERGRVELCPDVLLSIYRRRLLLFVASDYLQRTTKTNTERSTRQQRTRQQSTDRRADGQLDGRTDTRTDTHTQTRTPGHTHGQTLGNADGPARDIHIHTYISNK